jgi:cholesterol oxidase
VVDDAGEVRGHPGLTVLDGSIVPTALGVNPSKTIAALAERGMARMLAG